jgi:hypothetical protein
MIYTQTDPAELEAAKVKATGFGDTSLLVDADALAAERQVLLLKLKRAFCNEHATAATPNPDPEAVALAHQVTLLDGAIADAEAKRDRIVAATGTDVSGVVQPILDANRAQAESDYHDAEWSMVNVPELTPAQTNILQVKCDRAEREAAVIDGWGT